MSIFSNPLKLFNRSAHKIAVSDIIPVAATPPPPSITARKSDTTETAPELAFPTNLLLPGRRFAIYGGAERDTIVLAGNCVAETLAKGLQSLQGERHDYEICVWPLHLEPTPSPRVAAGLKQAKHVFIQQISHSLDLRISDHVSSGSKIHKFPSVSLIGLWPFDSTHYRPDEGAEWDANGVIRHRDGILAQLRKQIPDKHERFEAYRNLTVPGLAPGLGIKRRMEIQIEQLLNSDSVLGCEIGKFVSENYQERPLFTDCTHATSEVYQKVCAFCYELLGLQGHCPDLPVLDTQSEWNLPVHPGVARRLGVTWATEATKYRYGSYGKITWKQFITQYIERFG